MIETVPPAELTTKANRLSSLKARSEAPGPVRILAAIRRSDVESTVTPASSESGAPPATQR